MARKLAIVLTVLMLMIAGWALLMERSTVSIVIDGRQVAGPLVGTLEAKGLILALVALFCAATFMLFVFAGIWLIVLASFVIIGLIAAGAAFPFLLPLLIPLAVLWGFIAFTRRSKTP
ncbi:MAG: hypothetical protein WCH75_12540 [Candidatus Binatia bacterium]